MSVSEAEMQALVGHAFPGGTYRIEHWENYLLTEATGREPMPDDLAHPVHLFHVPISGVGVTLADLFALGQAETDFSINIDYYDWEFLQPLREGVPYVLRGGVIEHERTAREGGGVTDSVTFRIEMDEEGGPPTARVEFRWHFYRSAT